MKQGPRNGAHGGKERGIVFFALLCLAFAAATGCAGRRSAGSTANRKLPVCSSRQVKEKGVEGCRVVQEPYVRYDDPDAFVFNDLPVSLYFFPQQAPKGVEVKKPVRVKSVLSVRKGTCRDAGIAGLVKLQHLAARSKANAVINIRATWAKERLGDDLSFGCRVLRKRYLLVWEGSMATAPAANQNEGKTQSQERSESGRAKIDKGDIDARLRRLQDLYYKGLISKEEMESMRRKILDEL